MSWAWKRSALPCPLAAETPLGGHPCDSKGEGGGPKGIPTGHPSRRRFQIESAEIPKRMYDFIDYDKLMKTPLTENQCEDAIASLRALLDD